jgi:hypothetical protein
MAGAFHTVDGFANNGNTEQFGLSRRSIQLSMSIFDDVGKFFNRLGKNEPNFDLPEFEQIEGEYVGSQRIITIPGTSLVDISVGMDIGKSTFIFI